MATPIGLPKFLPCKTPKFSVTSSILSNGRERNKTPTFPISITTNPSAINLDHLSHLYAACNHSCHRFPAVDASTGRVEPVGVAQLAVAIAHSAVVVAVFALIGDDGEEEGVLQRIFRPAAKRAAPENGRLVGFGRAVSDMGLTASLYDVM